MYNGTGSQTMMVFSMIINGDCLDVLKTLPDNSVDSVVTDPPYGISYQSAWRTDTAKRKAKIAGDDNPFIWFLYDAFRVTRDGGGLICFCEWRHQEAFRMAISCAGYVIKSQVIWDRDWHGMGDLTSSFAPQHDVIWFAVKGKFTFPSGRPKSVLRYRRPSAEELVHPTEKPVDLMRDLVKHVTPPNGTVLDPFAGSGSTGKACALEGFGFIGIEREADYCAIAEARIAHVKQPKRAPTPKPAKAKAASTQIDLFAFEATA
jgi:site-specific DNA-methyltransferase (adenine-specific)